MTTPTTVTPPAAAAPPAQAAPVETTPTVDVAALQRQLDDLKAANEESRRTAEFWHSRATENPAPAAPAASNDDEADIDVLELATKGGKAFKAFLTGWAEQNGFVKGEAMTQAINQKAQELAKQGELVAKYPDLKKNDSEFFKATALEYGNLKKLPGITEALAMEMAAERVELRFLREGKVKTPAQITADKAAEKEQARRDRAAAGAGDRGGRRATSPEDESDDEMTDAQKQIAIRMLVDDETTPEQAIEKYKARATKGVAMRSK